MRKLWFGMVLFLCGCASVPVAPVDGELLVDAPGGYENLCFDEAGNIYVSGLSGQVLKLEQGRVTASRQVGSLCLGIVWHASEIYLGVQQADDEFMVGRIYRLDDGLTGAAPVSGPISGLNGFALQDGWLYYASSQGLLKPKGAVYRVNLNDPDFENPELFLGDIGWVNGLAFSHDGQTLYYTEMFKGVWAYDGREVRRIYDPGFMQVSDDLCVAPDGSLYVCSNSAGAILHLSPEGEFLDAWRPGDMGAPSSCAMSGTKIYITEFGQKAATLKQDGRGVWMVEP